VELHGFGVPVRAGLNEVRQLRLMIRRVPHMATVGCARRPEVIRHAVWLYLRFTLSYRDVEELLAERGLKVSYETVRRWVLKFGPRFARNLRRLRPRPADTWHLDEMVVSIQGRRMYLWRAVDSEGEIWVRPSANSSQMRTVRSELAPRRSRTTLRSR
jgi:hypothetical protein